MSTYSDGFTAPDGAEPLISADGQRSATPPYSRAGLPLVKPEGNAAIDKSDYYEWQKLLVWSGSKALTLASPVGFALAMHGHWGHGCRPSMKTLGEKTGLSESTAIRCIRTIRAAGLLRARPRPGRATVYCVPVIGDRRTWLPAGSGPCPVCYPAEAGSVSGDRPSGAGSVTGDLPPLSEATDDQDSLSRESAAAGPLVESRSQQDEELGALLEKLRPQVTDEELLIFMAVVREKESSVSAARLRLATVGLATADVLTRGSITSFIDVQWEPRLTKAQPKAQEQARASTWKNEAERKRNIICFWEMSKDDDQSQTWIGKATRTDDFYIDETLAAWREAGRGEPSG